ncbi:MAG: hypothetical protein WBC33_02195 [Conexibacter sp.]
MRRLLSAGALVGLALLATACGQDEAHWSGTWRTSYGTMVLHQDGTAVTGSYTFCDGTIDAEADGTRLSGTWHQRRGCDGTDSSEGPFDFELGSGETSFTGSWRYAGGGPAGEGRWTGRRSD